MEPWGLTKTYRAGEVDVPAIKGADFVIEAAAGRSSA